MKYFLDLFELERRQARSNRAMRIGSAATYPRERVRRHVTLSHAGHVENTGRQKTHGSQTGGSADDGLDGRAT